MDSDEKDLFKEAAEEAFRITSVTNIEDSKDDSYVQDYDSLDEEDEHGNSIYEAAAEIIDSEEEWLKLSRDMNGKHAKKFNRILSTLNDRDFIRAYMKSLEYFRPKIVRQDIKPVETVDNTININIVQVNKEGEVNVIKIGKSD